MSVEENIAFPLKEAGIKEKIIDEKVASALEVRAKVKGIDETQFQQIAEGAKDMCPISRALKGNVELSVNATLER